MSDQPTNPQNAIAAKTIEKIKREKEFKENIKAEKIEIKEHKDAKHEKIEKNEAKEHKDTKHEKIEKIEHKEHKDAKVEKIEKNELKEHKDGKIEIPEKQQFKEKEGKEIFEGPQDGPLGDPVEQRVSALEQQMAHFIGTDQRPDVSRGALSGEPDAGSSQSSSGTSRRGSGSSGGSSG